MVSHYSSFGQAALVQPANSHESDACINAALNVTEDMRYFGNFQVFSLSCFLFSVCDI